MKTGNDQLPIMTPPSGVKEIIDVSRSTALRLEADPSSGFPQRVRVSEGRTAWVTAELLTWVASRPRGRVRRVKEDGK